MKECGHSKYAKFCSEECAIEAHDLAHEEPYDWFGECDICYIKVKANEEKEFSNAGN